MLRVVLAAGLASYVALATGDVATFGEAPCAERCPDDDAQGNCDADCTDCVCCAHVRLSFAVAEARAPLPSEAVRVPEQQQAEPESPEPGDILHVPKTLRG
jgi:hypothetical protein